jgi:hypothetical protein
MMTITWNDNELDVEGRITKYYPATMEEPAEGGDVEIDAIWVTLKTIGGNLVTVNIMPVLSEQDYEEIEEIILESKTHE